MIYGEYAYDNFTRLNPLAGDTDLRSTAIHEYTHSMLSRQSVWGELLYCLKKLDFFMEADPPEEDKIIYETLCGFLNERTDKTQECTAVFIEMVDNLLNHGRKEVCSAVHRLETENVRYYHYLKPALGILGKISNLQDRNEILGLAGRVFMLARNCMNTPIYKMPAESFRRRKTIQKLVSRPEFSGAYIPDIIFVRTLKECDKLLKDKTAYAEIADVLDLYLTNEAEKPLTPEEELEEIKKFICTCLKDSCCLEQYRRLLNKVQIQEKASDKLFLQQLPVVFNEKDTLKNAVRVREEVIEKLANTNYTVLFLLGSGKECAEEISNRLGLAWTEALYEPAVLCGNAVLGYDLEKRKIYCSSVGADQFRNIVMSRNEMSLLVINYKLYDFTRFRMREGTYECEKFIYCDRTYENTRELIGEMNERGTPIYCRLIQYSEMKVLLCRLNKTDYFFLPMTPIVWNEAYADMNENYQAFVFLNEDSEDLFDDQVIVSQLFMDKMDTVINCMFFLNTKV